MDVSIRISSSEYLYFDISTSRSRGIGFISVSLCNEMREGLFCGDALLMNLVSWNNVDCCTTGTCSF